jgi:phosphoglucomutase
MKANNLIKFGTAGWIGVIGEEFTFQNVRLVSQAISNYLWKRGLAERGIIVGYDTRFLSERFAIECAKVLAANKINVLLCERDTPMPVLSYEVMRNSLGGAINFTASHNPPEYNGLKYSDEDGSPAMPEITGLIENEIAQLTNKSDLFFYYIDKSYIETFREQHHYLEYLKLSKEEFNFSVMKVAVDPLFGTARDYIDKLLFENGCTVHTIHNFRDPYFGGYSPEVSEDNLADLKRLVVEQRCNIGIAMDADADRFAIVDES